jgi:hypothetical protein
VLKHLAATFVIELMSVPDPNKMMQVGTTDGLALKNALAARSSVKVEYPTFKPGKLQDVNLASFSSRGPTSDGRLKPDVVCPGAQYFYVLMYCHVPGQLDPQTAC